MGRGEGGAKYIFFEAEMPTKSSTLMLTPFDFVQFGCVV